MVKGQLLGLPNWFKNKFKELSNRITKNEEDIAQLNNDVALRANVQQYNLPIGETKTIQFDYWYDTMLLSTSTTANTGQSGLVGFYVVHGRRQDLVPITDRIVDATNITVTSIVNGITITNNSSNYNAIFTIVSASSVKIE